MFDYDRIYNKMEEKVTLTHPLIQDREETNLWFGNPLKINSHTTVKFRVGIQVTTSGLAISTFVS
ncbi:hypothetical protein MTR_5g092020 [Medicago truncatula]|uniref:Uncharacterized protein n=1 Tax=Medicago truncatula TaxID=3880 RepID=G7K3F9_MEDTR|nr:hypothetical protein MTR_5g092020 [Medicago truncatula]